MKKSPRKLSQRAPIRNKRLSAEQMETVNFKPDLGPIPNVRALRERTGLNQQDFWTPFGVTQSGGSRYETGRTMPGPLRGLLRFCFKGFI
jgi:DNA-binding transcriptional regulator YiaG